MDNKTAIPEEIFTFVKKIIALDVAGLTFSSKPIA